VAQKIGRIENFAPPKAQGSRMPLVRAVYHDLLRRVAALSNQERNDGPELSFLIAPASLRFYMTPASLRFYILIF